MAYEITPQDFCRIVNNPKCQGQETEGAQAEVGHQNCSFCKGNYFVGGECNYGGRHKMTEDLKLVNQNFRAFDILVKQQTKLSQSKNKDAFDIAKNALLNSFQNLEKKCTHEATGFFYGSCIGLDGTQAQFVTKIKTIFQKLASELRYYMKRVEETTWEQLKSFQVKLEKLDKMQAEATQLAKEWKEETDPIKKAQLFALLSEKNQAIKGLQREIKKDPVYDIFSRERADELGDIVKNIFHGKGSFFSWKTREEKEAEEQKKEKILGVSKETWKNFALIGSSLFGLLIIYWIAKKQLKGTT
ncbi:MAG: hypothetical protein MRECE_9c046 [Mycoplasmataceae bacterium CE_OT135]|nr:MAG: hypothetical protein MRECE_9c046 [Mycoplasmataceae bacterium CE_OT135]